MAFLENLGKKVGEAAQAAAKKSGELVEVTKLNVSIGQEEDKIHKLYLQIGKSVYEKSKAEGVADDYVKEACDAVAAHEQNIKALREKIAEIKGIKSCVSCGAEMEKAQIFCSKCGAKNELPPPVAAQEPAEQQPEAKPVCPSCGAEVAEGSAFCTSCGTRL